MNSRRSSGKELPTKEVVGTFTGRTIVDFDSSISQTSGAKHGADGLLDDIEEDEDEDDEYFGDNFDEFGVLRPRGTWLEFAIHPQQRVFAANHRNEST